MALAGLGNNVRMVNIGGGSNGASGNSFMDFLMSIPEMAEVMRAKVEALSGDELETTALRMAKMFEVIRSVRGSNEHPQEPLPPAGE